MNSEKKTNGSWEEYRTYFLSTLDSLVNDNEEIKKEMTKYQIEMINKIYQTEEKLFKRIEEIATETVILKMRSTILGAVVGFCSSGLLVLLIKLIEKFIIKV